jgi:hypothetical protein
MSSSLVYISFKYSFAGVSRSASLIIAFLMKHNMWSMENALEYVRIKRPCVSPNFGFRKHLKRYEYDLGLISKDELNSSIDELTTTHLKTTENPHKIFYAKLT